LLIKKLPLAEAVPFALLIGVLLPHITENTPLPVVIIVMVVNP